MRSETIPVQFVTGDVWRRELCPGCGARLIGLAAWKAHGVWHSWGSDWFAVRLRAARPGETIAVDPKLLGGTWETVPVQTVEDATWKAGVPG